MFIIFVPILVSLKFWSPRLSHIPETLEFLYFYEPLMHMQRTHLFRININELKKVAVSKLIRSGVTDASHGKPRFIVAGITGFGERRRVRIKT